LVSTIVDDGFVQRPETGSRVRRNILETERFDDINHEVRPRMVCSENFHVRRNGLGFRSQSPCRRQSCSATRSLSLLRFCLRSLCNQAGRTDGRALKKATTINPVLLRIPHWRSPFCASYVLFCPALERESSHNRALP